VIGRSDYETLLARAGDETAEDAATARIVEVKFRQIHNTAVIKGPDGLYWCLRPNIWRDTVVQRLL